MLIKRPIISRGVLRCMSVIDTDDVTACAAPATSSKLNESHCAIICIHVPVFDKSIQPQSSAKLR